MIIKSTKKQDWGISIDDIFQSKNGIIEKNSLYIKTGKIKANGQLDSFSSLELDKEDISILIEELQKFITKKSKK